MLHTAIPSSVRGGDVDVVVADRDRADDAQPTSRARLEHGGVDGVGQEAQDPVELGGLLDELVAGRRPRGLHDLVPGGGSGPRGRPSGGRG